MYETESSAKSKWCPFARTIVPDDKDEFSPAANRVSNGQQTGFNCALCIASRCMAWRQATLVTPTGERTGYCGLAGTPANFITH